MRIGCVRGNFIGIERLEFMSTKSGMALVAAAVLLLAAVPLWAQTGAESAAKAAADTPKVQEAVSMAKALAIVGACLGAGLSAVGGGYGIARIGSSCIESIARQPEAGGAMFAPMVVAAAMIEGGMLLAIVVCILGVLFI